MKTNLITTFGAFLALSLATQADAGLYDITFDDGNGNIGSGQIDVESAGNSLYYAASGYLDLTSGGASGNWDLYTAGGSASYPGYIYSPSGAYIYNNAVYSTGQNPEYPATNPLLDDYGLLFTQSNGDELNLWGNADGTYTLGGNIAGYQNFNVNIGFGGTPGTPLITPVPEPATITLATTFLLVLTGLGTWRGKRDFLAT
jgi:hypothetical protein